MEVYIRFYNGQRQSFYMQNMAGGSRHNLEILRVHSDLPHCFQVVLMSKDSLLMMSL